MEGFWTLEFQGIEGWGTGVVTLIGGRVLGGDEGYLYIGSYTQTGNVLSAHVHVAPFVPGIRNVMGQSEFDLDITGIDMIGAARPKTLLVEGRIPGTELIVKGSLTKRADLPR
jgi:hypothetical protein